MLSWPHREPVSSRWPSPGRLFPLGKGGREGPTGVIADRQLPSWPPVLTLGEGVSGRQQWLGDTRKAKADVRGEPGGQPAVPRTLSATSVPSRPCFPAGGAGALVAFHREPCFGGMQGRALRPRSLGFQKPRARVGPTSLGHQEGQEALLRFRCSRREREFCFWDLLAPAALLPPQDVSLTLVCCPAHLPAFARAPQGLLR